MAEIANITRKEIQPALGMEIVRGTVTSSGDTYKSRLGNIRAVFVHDETAPGRAKATFSGQTVTVTCTNGDVVDLIIFGG